MFFVPDMNFIIYILDWIDERIGQMKNDSRAGVKLRLEFDKGILSYSGVMRLVT